MRDRLFPNTPPMKLFHGEGFYPIQGNVHCQCGLCYKDNRHGERMASAGLGYEVDLEALVGELEGADYDPEQFPGVVYRTKEPRAAILLFRSGKIVCTGAKSIDSVHEALWVFAEKLRELGLDIEDDLRIGIQNLVASADIGYELNLAEVAIKLGLESVEYDPDSFPGLVFALEKPRVLVLVFSSGKIVITGANGPNAAHAAVTKTANLLRGFGYRHASEGDQSEGTQDEESGSEFLYDVFISHASEDKDNIVRPLAQELASRDLDVWFDEHELSIGDNLRHSIDEGLQKSRYGIVVISENFFEKRWTQYELDILVSRHMEEDKVILPLWFDVERAEVAFESPVLANFLAERVHPDNIPNVVDEIEAEVKG